MATKSAGKKASAKKAAATKASAEKKRPGLKITRDTVTFTLSAEQKKQMKACLEKSGQVRIKFKEISVTRIPASVRSLVVSD